MKKLKLNGFTLVELIIVITILAILATIGFVSFQSYTKTTRDSHRLATLRNIETGLNIFQAQTQKYPEVDEGISIQSSGGTVIGYQGYIGENVSKILKMNSVPFDPQDNTKYVYAINAAKNKYQLLGFMEGDEYKLSYLRNIYADFVNRNPKTLGNSLGILLDSNNNPVTTNIIIDSYTGSLKVILKDNKKLEGTGSTIKTIISTYKDGKSWRDLDPNCPLEDIVVGNQIWAGCNSTLGNGFEWGQTDANIGTNYYSGVVGNCFKTHSGVVNNSDCAFGTGVMASNANPKVWFPGTNGSGDGTYDTIWGKFYIFDNSPSACPSGWHVPNEAEWTALETYLNGTFCRGGDYWTCNGLGWKNNGINTRKMAEVLKAPLSGYRAINGTTFYNRGYSESFWVSNTNNIYTRDLYWDENRVSRTPTNKNQGSNVRCIKD